MNPISNLPAIQDLKRPQQNQGYNRQYFGNDEIDEVVLSNKEEQKKKKAWTIGTAILGTLALVGGTLFGLNRYGIIGKDAKNLKGFKSIKQGEGDKAKTLASIAQTDKAWTGSTWGGVAETIKSTLENKNETKFQQIIFVGSEDSQKALKNSLGEAMFSKLQIINAKSDNVKAVASDAAREYGAMSNNLIIADSAIDNLYDEIEKAITSLNDPTTPATSGTPGTSETHATPETSGTSEASEIKTPEQADARFEKLKESIKKADTEIKALDEDNLKPENFGEKLEQVDKQLKTEVGILKELDTLNKYYAQSGSTPPTEELQELSKKTLGHMQSIVKNINIIDENSGILLNATNESVMNNTKKINETIDTFISAAEEKLKTESEAYQAAADKNTANCEKEEAERQEVYQEAYKQQAVMSLKAYTGKSIVNLFYNTIVSVYTQEKEVYTLLASGTEADKKAAAAEKAAAAAEIAAEKAAEKAEKAADMSTKLKTTDEKEAKTKKDILSKITTQALDAAIAGYKAAIAGYKAAGNDEKCQNAINSLRKLIDKNYGLDSSTVEKTIENYQKTRLEAGKEKEKDNLGLLTRLENLGIEYVLKSLEYSHIVNVMDPDNDDASST